MKTKVLLVLGFCLTVILSLYLYQGLFNRNTVTNFYIKSINSKTKNTHLEVSYKKLDSLVNVLSAYNINTNDTNKLNQFF